jgi:2-iminobutanoate/2-iminopropanoate deaminase
VASEAWPVELFLNPDRDPIAVGLKVGDLVHATRIVGAEPETGQFGASIEWQLELAYANLRAAVESAGGSVDNIAQVSFFLKRFEDRAAINDGWVAMFPNERDRPTYKFMAADLPGDLLVQLETFAVLGARRRVVNIPGVAHTNPIPMGVRIGRYAFSSRILPLDPATGKPPEGLDRQAEVLFGNVRAFLAAADVTPANVTQARVFILDRSLLPALEPHWSALFPDSAKQPVRHVVTYPQTPALQVYLEIIAEA